MTNDEIIRKAQAEIAELISVSLCAALQRKVGADE